MFFNSATSERLDVYSQFFNFTISILANGPQNAIASDAFFGLTVWFLSVDDRAISKEKVKTYLIAQSSPLGCTFFLNLYIYSLCVLQCLYIFSPV